MPAATSGYVRSGIVVAASLACLASCIGGRPAYVPAPIRASTVDEDPEPQSDALKHLAGRDGPPRFAKVADGVYRGGQPSLRDLEALKAIGVETILDLRKEDEAVYRQEEAWAHQLGLRFQHFPFYGIFGADKLFLDRILAEMKKGHVYIHCKNGRDRTSLLVALYRVLQEGWEPRIAWKLEVLDYGYQPTYFYRQLRTTFDTMVRVNAPQQATR